MKALYYWVLLFLVQKFIWKGLVIKVQDYCDKKHLLHPDIYVRLKESYITALNKKNDAFFMKYSDHYKWSREMDWTINVQGIDPDIFKKWKEREPPRKSIQETNPKAIKWHHK